MRRLAAIGTVLLAAAIAFALTAFGGAAGSHPYRFDAIFDNASFLIPGQDVRIAGANVGSVTRVSVTPDNHARIEMKVDKRFGPFHSDADCFIAPQSLIGERFVQCTTGTPSGTVLRAEGGHAPTVPLANTHSPVDPDLVLDTYRLPYRERLTIILNELGAGLSGNGGALNAAIRRAAPAIQATDDVLRQVDRDRAVLGDLIDRSDEVIGELARRRGRVASFVQEAADVSQTAAERRGAISEGIRRLPASLHETRASLDALRGLANRSRPLLGDLSLAADPVARLIGDVPPLAAAARPALSHLGRMARVGTAALHDGAPVVRRLKRFSDLAVPVGRLGRELNESMRANGAVEGIQTFVTNIAISLARFDNASHILPSYVVAPPECGVFASTTTPSCDAHFAKGAQTATARRAERRAHRRAAQRTTAVPRPSASAPDSAPPAQRAPAAVPDLPSATGVADRLLHFLLG
jgi:phospholipid/cholesterol/gamma-HCH transport system substrate-binding protein